MPNKSEKRTLAKRKAALKGKIISAQNQLKSPVASRPVIPATYGTATSSKGMLDWTWARERLTKSHNYVIVTVRPDGCPHAMGMHGLWFEDAFYFGTAETTRKAKNLAANPHCILISEQLEELVIVEGKALQIGYDAIPQGLSAASKKKYGWPIDPEMGGVVYKLTPQTIFALPEKLFATALTRWKFEA